MIKIAVCTALFASLLGGDVLADCPSQTTKKTPPHFVLNAGEVLDKRTGLIWNRCSVGMHWQKGKGCIGERQFLDLAAAKQAAQKAGSGWRLPSIKELAGLMDNKCTTPAIDSTVFPDIGPPDAEESPYWTSTSAGMGMIYYVDFMMGLIDAHTPGFQQAVRLVRSEH